MTQQFLITVHRMCTSDEADLVGSWTAVIAEEDLSNFGGLVDAARLTELSLMGCPATNVRPMTEVEIAEWRDAQKD